MRREVIFLVLIYFLTHIHGWGQKVFFSGNDDNSIVICEDGKVYMSGENNTGQLGRGSFVPSNVFVPLGGINGVGALPRCKQAQIEGVATFIALSFSGDTVLGWGPNESGQAGDGTTEVKTSPVIVKGVGGTGILGNIKQIATGNNTAYALTEDGKVVSWGVNSFGQAGIGTTASPVLYPTYVLRAANDTLKNVKSISAGGVFCVALLCDGSVYAWGRNNVGQLGQNTTVNSPYAIPVKNRTGTGLLRDIIKIEAGDNYALALSSTDTLWSWGPNWDGRLGTGDNLDHFLPFYVKNSTNTGKLSGVIDMAAGQGHGLVLMSDKSVYAWGVNNFGQLGINDTLNRGTPVRVKDPGGSGFLSNVNHISAGDKVSMARTDNNDLYLWGENTLGQLGLDDHIHRHLPVLIALPCELTRDTYPGTGKMEYTPATCIGTNSGIINLVKHHSTIARWERSFTNFSSLTTEINTNYSTSYTNLNQTAYFRAVLKECNTTFYSPVAIVSMDSLSQGGHIDTSATVRAHRNKDTLTITGYKGSVVRWESSIDNFQSEINPVSTSMSSLPYSGISTTTYYRALIKRGLCPAVYSDTAVIRVVDQTAVKIYNGFTPDGDNINDEWIIDLIELFPNNKVNIYNRWGQPVYSVSYYDNQKNVWKGENNVSDKGPVADGTYFYVVDLGEGFEVLKGYVVISRGN